MRNSNKMAFTPVIFKNIGKSVSDLFKNDTYDVSKNTFSLKTKAANGLNWTATSKITEKAHTAELGLKYSNGKYGSVEVTGTPNSSVKVKAAATKLYKGLTVEGSFEDKGKVKCTSDVAYKQDFVAATLSNEASQNDEGARYNNVTAAAVIGFDGVSVGASVTSNVSVAAFKPTDYNGAFQYEQSDLTVSVVTEEMTDKVTLSAEHKVNSDFTFAAQAVYHFKKDDAKTLALGGKYQIDSLTAIKGKVDQAGNVSTVVDHQVRPWAKLGVTSVFNAKAMSTPKFGLSFTFGETA